MKNKIMKPIVRVGTSAGVVLPKKWLNGTALVELIEEPLDPLKDVLELLGDRLKDVKGIYLVGSYARGEYKVGSDIDVLVITKEYSEKIKKGKYEVIIISEEKLKGYLGKMIFPLYPMIREARVLINSELIEKYRAMRMSEKGLKFHVGFIKSAMDSNIEEINLVRMAGEDKVGDGVSYSLVLRLRELYVLDCLKENKIWSNKGLISLVKEVSGSEEAYEGYLNIKKDGRSMKRLPVEKAEKLLNYIKKEVMKWEKRED